MDFGIKIYRKLLHSLRDAGYVFLTYAEYLNQKNSGKFDAANPHGGTSLPSRFVILRHDVDLLPTNSLAFARIQQELGIRGTYYFRAVPESWDESIIREVYQLGHEIGYHYEDMDLVMQKHNPDQLGHNPGPQRRLSFHNSPEHSHAALSSFLENLENLRKLVPVTTICMHGSPRSPYDNRDLWKDYDYRNWGLWGEPYFDADFDRLFYLTDTGRRWDGWKVSVRDKLPQQKKWVEQGLVFHSTHDIIQALKENKLPHQLMMTFHPQRWTDKPLPWLLELVHQKIKNQVKLFLIYARERKP